MSFVHPHHPRRLALVLCTAAALSASACSIRPVSPVIRLREEPAARPAKRVTAPPTPAWPEEPEVVSLPVPGSPYTSARATVAVHAPIDRVRAVVFAFDRYPEFMSNYGYGKVTDAPTPGARLL